MARLVVRFAILAVLAGLSWLVLSRLRYHWDWSAVWAYRSIFVDGLGLTLAVSVVAITLLNTGATGLAIVNWKALALAAVILALTRWVKPTKGLHPIVFILASAVVGVVFSF